MLAPVASSPAKTMPPLATVAVSAAVPSPQAMAAVYSAAESLSLPVVVRLPGSVKVATTWEARAAPSATTRGGGLRNCQF